MLKVFTKKIYCSLVLLCTLISVNNLQSQQILISEISLCTNEVELFNAGTSAVNLSTWWLCNRSSSTGPFYSQISSLVAAGSTTINPGSYLTINWSSIAGPTGELGLYINSQFGNSNSIHDYLQYNIANSPRAGTAVAANIWDSAAEFVTIDDSPGCATYIANAADPASSNSTTWCQANSNTLGTTNSTCIMDEILISEVSLCTNEVELVNSGATTVDIGSWILCNRSLPAGPFYRAISLLVPTGVSTVLNPGDYITINWSAITGPDGEIGLYIRSGFSNPDNIRDYVQFNSGGNPRAVTAVAAGVWDSTADYVTIDDSPGCATVIANATDPASANSTTWCEATSNTLGGTNSGCIMLSNCPDDYANGGSVNSMPSLTGAQTSNADFETDGAIISNQTIATGVIVDYDSATSIELETGFEVQASAIFHAFIDGCVGLM